MKLETLNSAEDADWLALRLELWPDCPRDRHLEEMTRFLMEPARYAQFIVRTSEGRGIGLVEASIRTDDVNGTSSSPVAYLEGLFVKAEARRRGVARRLVDAVSEWAMSRGCAELASDTQLENRVSQATHLRLGFTETERAVFYCKQLGPNSETESDLRTAPGLRDGGRPMAAAPDRARSPSSMTARCAVFIATSLDGFIAREDGAIDWLEQANASVPAGEDCGYSQFMASIDALIMGRASFEKVLSFPAWPYGDTPVYVLSASMQRLPPGTAATVSLLNAPPEEVVQIAAAAGHRHLYVDGGRTIQSFLAAGLISELTITVVPVLIGAGIPLFGRLPADVGLRLLSSRAFPFGFVQSHYSIARSP